jgi:hypothetical protein
MAPILKEYRLAETGQTNGIAMTVRKAPKMKALKQTVKRITAATVIMTFFSMFVAYDFTQDLVH